MDNHENHDPGFDARHDGSFGLPASADNDSDEIHGLPEWWELEAERFDGEWLIADGCGSRKASIHVASMARLLVLQVALRCIRRVDRGEDILDHLEVTRAYLQHMKLRRAERIRLERIVAALHPFDVAAAGDALMATAWSAQRAGLDSSAQVFLMAAYECARRFDLHEIAAAAADAFAGVARMHECPRAARKWRGRAYVHARRAARCYRS